MLPMLPVNLTQPYKVITGGKLSKRAALLFLFVAASISWVLVIGLILLI